MNDSLKKALQKEMDELSTIFFQSIKQPKLKPPLAHEVFAERLMKKIICLFFNSKNTKRKKGRSVWGEYALLNLRGLSKYKKTINATRFGHFEIMQGSIVLEKNEIQRAFKNTFTLKESRFPWMENGSMSEKIDNRFSNIDFGSVDVLYLCENTHTHIRRKHKRYASASLMPIVIIADERKMTCLSVKEAEAVRECMRLSPFVVFMKIFVTEQNTYTVGHIICNHEFMDGLPAAYYLHSLMVSLGLSKIPLHKIDKELLLQAFEQADKREHYDLNASNQVFTRILGTWETKRLLELHQSMSKQLQVHGLSIDFAEFLQIFILSVLQCEQQKIRCTALKFNRNIDRQLDLYDAGKTDKLMFYMIWYPEKVRTMFNNHIQSDMKIRVFPKSENVIANVVAPFMLHLPGVIFKKLNFFANILGAAKVSSGQLMISYIPNDIRVLDKTISLGNGFAGPACTKYQQAAYTISLVTNENKVVEDIVIRRKYKHNHM
jgi:hypothetical protein